MESTAEVVFSIDLELEIERQSWDRQDRLAEIGSELLRLLDRHQIPATWGVADPSLSAATESILASSTPHEVAVLGDRSFLASTTPSLDSAWRLPPERLLRPCTRP